MKKFILFMLTLTAGCSQGFHSSTATTPNPIALSSATFSGGHLTLNGAALDTITGVNVSQAGMSLPMSVLSQTASVLTLALSGHAAIQTRKPVDVTLTSAVQSFSVSLSIDLSGTTVSNLTVSGNAGSLQPNLTGTLMQMGNADGTATRLLIDGYAAQPVITYRAALGTAAAPSAVTSGTVLGTTEFDGYGLNAYSSAGRASVSALASETWSNTAQGTALIFSTTANTTTSTTERMRIDQSGFVGIGTTTPSAPLSVSGSGAVAIFTDGVASCTVTPSTPGSVSCTSDERLKHDIQAIDDGATLEKLLRLKSVTYRWRSGEQSVHTGFIAQQVRSIAPEFVNTSPNGYMQVSYVGFIPWITSAIREFYKEFSDSREEIEKLKAKNADLERRLEALEKK